VFGADRAFSINRPAETTTAEKNGGKLRSHLDVSEY
jgi:hypothetical protein